MNEIVHDAFRDACVSVQDALVDAVERSALRTQPFDHIYMDQVIDPAAYRALIAAMPPQQFYHQLRHVDAMRDDGNSTRLRMYLYPELLGRLPAKLRRVWRPIARALCSDALEGALKRKFRTAIEERFGKPIDRIALYPIPILLRDQPGYRIGVHSDALSKAITVQFYLPEDNSQRHLGTIFHEGETGAPAERTTQMPFMPASGYAFSVSGTKSWHSAATTTKADGERTSMMVTYYVADTIATKLKYRLRRIGLAIGLHPAG